MPESKNMAQRLRLELGQTEPGLAKAVPWSHMFIRSVAAMEAHLMNTVEDIGRWRTVSNLITQTKGIFSSAKSMATAFLPGSVREQSPRRSALYLTFSDASFLEARIVESQDQPSHATYSRATLPCATAFPSTSPRDKTLITNVVQNGVQINKPNTHTSNSTNLEDIAGHEVGVTSCSPPVMPTASSQLPEKPSESNKATEDSVQYPHYDPDTKPIGLEIPSNPVHSLEFSPIPITTQNKPAVNDHKSPTADHVLMEGRAQTPSHSHSNMETHAPSRPDKQKQAKRSKRAKKIPKGRGVKNQGLAETTKHMASNLPKFTAKPLKRSAALSESDEDLEGQNHEQKAKRAKKAHESRVDLDEAMMDAPTTLPELAVNYPNQGPKRKSQCLKAETLRQKQPKRAGKCPPTTGVEGDGMMDGGSTESHIPTLAPPTTEGAVAMSLKRGPAAPEANGSTISSNAAKKPKQKHEGKLPIDVCIEFEDITQLVDARLREKEEKRQEERKRREAPKIRKRSRSKTAAAEAEGSAKKPKTAKTPELPKALKRGRGLDDETEKPNKKAKSKKD